jgi:phthiocerol/phenolphthiocerol synthesis type-I polyketide synthase E
MNDDGRTLPPDPSDVAVIGLACRFPGADGPEAFWRNLRAGVDSISFFSDEELLAAGIPESVFRAPNYVRAHGVIEGVELFDAGFFGYAPREAEVMDPQQRLFLECAWQALESAGYDASRVSSGEGAAVIGVWGGVTLSSYLLALHPLRDRLQAIGVDTTMLAVGNDKDSLAPRIAYKLDLRGPAVTVQTACSTALVAVHMACQSLLAGETDMALAGAVSLTLPMKSGYLYQEGGIFSPDGHCRAFDERAAGTVFGCGAGMVVLKRLEEALADGDTIHAVLRGTAVNNDGAGKAGFTAPSVAGQAEVIAEALANAGLSPDDIGYVEAHGTATALGDPVEIAGLTRAFRSFRGGKGGSTRRGFCALGTVKTNLGHLEAAAGIAGLIKTVLALKHGEIPPSLHFSRPNPQIDFAASPFFVNTELSPWPSGNRVPRRAGVSSFGFGGTNAHVVLEEPPAPVSTAAGEPAGAAAEPDRPWHLLLLSARSGAALRAATGNLVDFLDRNPDADTAAVAYTLQAGRRAFEHRRAVACQNASDGRDALASGDPTRGVSGAHDGGERQVAFLFPGQGAQHPGMARGIYKSEPLFRAEIDRVADLFFPATGVDLRRFLTSTAPEEGELLERTENAQPALFAVCYALAKLWRSWGITPRAMLGNSLGEYVAACLAGVFSLEDAVALVAARGRLMRELPAGDMLAVALPERDLLPLLGPEISLAAIHGAEMCIVSGPPAAAARLQERLAERGVESPRLHTSHAFHSAATDPILAAFEAEVRRVRLAPPGIPVVSNVTGRFLTPAEATDPAYWSRHLRQTVRLADGLGTLLGLPGAVLLEVGPAQALSGAARQHPARTPGQAVHASLPHPKDSREDGDTLLTALGGLWVAGVEVDWPAFHAGRRRRRVPLPTYPFERQRYWIDFERLAGTAAAPTTSIPGIAAPTVETAAPLALQAPAPPAPTPSTTAGGSYVANRYATAGESTSYVAPGNEIEEILADLWQTLLGIERVGVEDNFFRLNGNSLIALQALSRIQAVFGVKLSVRSFFETPTVAGLSRIIALRQPGLEALAEKARILEEVQGLSAAAVAAELTAPVPPLGPPPPPPPPSPVSPVESPREGDGADGRDLRFSLFFFSGNESMFPEYKYELIVEAAKFADRNGFTAIWTPERHFHSFGGLYPNPSVLAAALAMVTERLSLRAGSVVLPLHNPIRVAEEWSVVDNLSRGRVGLSFASGFHPNDFTFSPASFARRRDEMFEKIGALRQLWRGERLRVPGGAGNEIDVEIFPKPVQRELPIWVTCANHPQTFEETGKIGANVLTSLIGLTTDALAERIALYRQSLARHGHDPRKGQVAVMLHTFVGTDLAAVKEKVRGPFCDYLRSHTELLTSLAKSLHQSFDDQSFAKEDLEELLQMEFERYFASGSLLGTPESCRAMVHRLREIGVDELGCLLDFGVDVPSIMESLQHLNELRRRSAREALVAGPAAG